MKKIIFSTLMLLALQTVALDFVYSKTGWLGEGNKYAVEGYDTVNYFTENKPAKGSKNFAFKYRGKEWHFKNAQNLALFKANPQKYAPQYGGHCAWRMGDDGGGVYGDAKLWTIIDDKLYLNYNQKVQNRWEKDISGFIMKADEFWLGKHGFKSLN